MTVFYGLLLGLFSGIMTGSFSLPMKKTTRWSWEATWLVWSICALFIIPWIIAIITVPNLFSVFDKASLNSLVLVFVFGLCWGLGAVFFGQSIAMIGISLAFALCIGLSTALGALIPMFKDPGVFLTAAGIWSISGIGIMVVGVAACAAAGHQKEKQLQLLNNPEQQTVQNKSSSGMILGLILAALGGILSSMLNFAFNLPKPLILWHNESIEETSPKLVKVCGFILCDISLEVVAA